MPKRYADGNEDSRHIDETTFLCPLEGKSSGVTHPQQRADGPSAFTRRCEK
jgi:hypothetical protein